MKKLLTILTIFLTFGIVSQAQSISANPQLNVGIKGGVNFYNTQNNSNVRTGYHAGVLGHIHFTHSFALQPEVTYSQQGAKYNNGDIVHKLKLNYINVPVMFQYMFNNGFRLQGGPQLGFLVNAKDNNVNVNSNFKTLDFAVGLGASYVNPPTGLGIDFRYNIGLNDINKSSIKSSNRGFQLGVFSQIGNE